MAGFPRSHMRSLLVGTMMSGGAVTTPGAAGIAPPGVPIIIGRQMDADQLFGQGSELANSFKAFFRNNFANEVWGVGVSEPPGGSAASGTITIGSAATEAGTISLYIAGTNVQINIYSTATVNSVAQSVAQAINETPDLPVTATATGAVVTLTAKWFGITGNDITMMDSYYGKIGGDVLPLGLTLIYSGYTLLGGVGVPNWSATIANLGETEYEYVSLPYTDSNTLLAWEGEWDFSDTGRWGKRESAPLLSN